MYDFYMRPKNQRNGITAVGFADMRAFMEFVQKVGEVTIVKDRDDKPPLLLIPKDQ